MNLDIAELWVSENMARLDTNGVRKSTKKLAFWGQT